MRPWSPGPWGNLAPTFPHHENCIENYALASKAPELAELLISLVKLFLDIPDPHGMLEILTEAGGIVDQAEKLLKEVGYQEE